MRSLLLLPIALLACTSGGDSAADTTAAADTAAAARDTVAAARATGPLDTTARLAVVPGFRTPESVRYDAEQDVYFVSNIDGVPNAKDNNGYIARLHADSTGVAPTMLVQGGRNGVTLHAPKGMAIVGDTLWVTDIDAVRGFDRRTGAVVATIDLRPLKVVFANDLAAGIDGTLYVTETGIRFDAAGRMSHPGTDQVIAIKGRTATTVLGGGNLGSPNGIAWDARNARWILGGFAGKELLAWNGTDSVATTIVAGPGGYDGIEALPDGRVLVTSWSDSTVHELNGTTLTPLVRNVTAPADIGIDTKRNLLLVPRFQDNRVEVWRLR